MHFVGGQLVDCSKTEPHVHGYTRGRPLKPGLLSDRIRRKKSAARKKVQYALKIGRLVKPRLCEYDGCDSKNTEAHHPDYDTPLDVLWLCRRHHVGLHKALKS